MEPTALYFSGRKHLLEQASFFGLPFLNASDIEDCFVEDLLSDMPADPRCSLFADYILKNYVASNSK
jgi:hypothetical protein